MLPSPFSALPSRSDFDSCASNKTPAGEQNPCGGYYRPSGQGDIFLFSPSLCSRSSNESTSQSSSSFDTLSYSFSPADLSSASKSHSPPSLPIARTNRSPAFVEAYLSGAEPKPITRFSPSTPFQELFNSSPAGYWQGNDLSVSPISRHSSVPVEPEAPADAEDSSDDEEASCGKIESLIQYEKGRGIPDSPPTARPSSPSSLSSLSSIPSSPSALFSAVPFASSQTSHGPTPSSSPGNNASVLSPLASPFKLYPKAAPSTQATPSRRRSRRTQVMQRTTRRSLAAEILNQLGQHRGKCAKAPVSSSMKISSTPMPALSDSDDENYEPVAGPSQRTRKRALPSTSARGRRSPSRRKRRRTTGSAPSGSTIAAASSSSTSRAPAPQEQDDDPEDVPTYPNRTFPLRVPIHDNFPLFYRRFPVSSAQDEDLAAYDPRQNASSGNSY